jgi:hypothetical protein
VIAQNLFLTARTVEGHLTRACQKLAITSRERLPAALASPDSGPAGPAPASPSAITTIHHGSMAIGRNETGPCSYPRTPRQVTAHENK